MSMFSILSYALLVGQTPDSALPPPPPSPRLRIVQNQYWLLNLKLRRAQEITWRGVFEEKSLADGMRFERRYRFFNRLFVLDSDGKKSDLAFLTTHRGFYPTRSKTKGSEKALPRSVRLARFEVDRYGKIKTAAGVDLLPPLEGPPLVEMGALMELPLKRVAVGRSWVQTIPGKPARSWRAVSTEMVNGVRCIKLQGLQQSFDWDRPRADSTAWRRRMTVWLSPSEGFAHRVERIIEKRLPAHTRPTHQTVLRYELESSLNYPPTAVEDSRQEIVQAADFGKRAETLLKEPSKSRRELTGLLNQIQSHLKYQRTATPYREAILAIERRVKSGLRGEIPAQLPKETAPIAFKTKKAILGKPAPDFVADHITEDGLARLKQWKGKPILMVFYHPESSLLRELLPFLEEAKKECPDLQIVGLAMTKDVASVRELYKKRGLKFPTIQGSGLRGSYDVEATPKMMLLDERGIVRANQLGWGREMTFRITESLKQVSDESQQKTQSLYGPGWKN